MKEKGCSVTTSYRTGIPAGTLVTGRWRGGRYVVQRLLGQGANGIVYLVQQAGTRDLYALKMGYDALDLQSEINVLKALQRQAQSNTEDRDLSYLVEVDDYTLGDREIPFYVMRYVKGEPLSKFLTRRGAQWLDLAGLNLLKQLAALHKGGWVFGDLKPDNVLVSAYGDVELIDYGGVSQNGRSVKQFTEWYDRGFWNAGGRTADPAYDWFSFAVVCIHMLSESRLKSAANQLPQTRSAADLVQILNQEPRLRPYSHWLKKAISGGFAHTDEAYEAWKRMISRKPVRQSVRRTPGWLKSAFAISLCMLVCAIYLTLR
ncbi:serine/threonine protein kinase [Paenibacillus sp. YPG26]|uniref:serine/threonine protein kinase n=1 Tax=Paenibacillus sp. YPG26 TaxID=2878915 RepID=UPI00203A48EF|nr:serine/threonine protein kinase [Paenibacillus sp. YPG26]USB33320.1 serine/threonine protein kinase [Paenibacillus sp. YPG26]